MENWSTAVFLQVPADEVGHCRQSPKLRSTRKRRSQSEQGGESVPQDDHREGDLLSPVRLLTEPQYVLGTGTVSIAHTSKSPAFKILLK